MLDMAAKAHRLLGCKGASRSDFRWDDEPGEAGIYLLEINTQPGMTPLSLVPEQAKYRGISYGELVERLIEEALGRGKGAGDAQRGGGRRAASSARPRRRRRAAQVDAGQRPRQPARRRSASPASLC